MVSKRKCARFSLSCWVLAICSSSFVAAQEKVPPVEVKDSQASTESEMKPYAEIIEQTDATIEMLPIPGGKFLMGSPEAEEGRRPDEGPQHEVEISPFWMAKTEITWNAYDVWASTWIFIAARC